MADDRLQVGKLAVEISDRGSVRLMDSGRVIIDADWCDIIGPNKSKIARTTSPGRQRAVITSRAGGAFLRKEIILSDSDAWITWHIKATKDTNGNIGISIPKDTLQPPFFFYKAVNPSPFGKMTSIPDSHSPYSIIWGDERDASELQMAAEGAGDFFGSFVSNEYRLVSTFALKSGEEMRAVVHYASRLKDAYPTLAFDKNYLERGLLSGELPSIVSDGFAIILARGSRYVVNGMPFALHLKYYALDNVARNVRIDYKVVDANGQVAASGRRTLSGDGADFTAIRQPLKLNKNGMYRVEVEYSCGKIKRQRETVFAVIPKVPPTGFREDSIFGAHNGGRDYWINFSQRMGIKWDRRHCGHGDTGWNRVELRKDEYDWSRVDAANAVCDKHGILTLGSFTLYAPYSKYGIEASPYNVRNLKELFKSDFDEFVRVYLDHYVIPIVTRYKNEIRYWEVENEPYYWYLLYDFCPEKFVQFQKAVYQAIKNIDPGIKVVGTCGPPGSMGYQWYEETFSRGALESQDIVSAHLYPWGQWWNHIGTELEVRKWIHKIRDIMRANGRELPVWNSETTISPPATMYTLPYHHKYIRYQEDEKSTHPVDYAQEYFRLLTIHKVEDVKYFYFLLDGGSEYYSHASEYDDTPFSLLVAQAAMAKHYEGAKLVEEIKWDKDVLAFLFKNERGYFLVPWGPTFKDDEYAEVTIALPSSHFSARDIFDNPFAVQGDAKNTQLRITSEGFYLYGNGCSERQLLDALRSARVEVMVNRKQQAALAEGKYQGRQAVEGDWIGYHSVDISGVANRGLADEFPFDKQGGWTDEGTNDMRNLAPGEWLINDVPFRILDPDKNDDKSVIVLKGYSVHYFPERVSIPVGKRISKLSFLHTVSYGNNQDIKVPAFTYILRFADGYEQKAPMYCHTDVEDWGIPSSAPSDAKLAWEGPNPIKDKVRVWQKDILIAHPKGAAAQLDSIDIVSEGQAVPVILAITGSSSN